MQYLIGFNEGFFDFFKPKIKKVSFAKREVEFIYDKITKMIKSPFIVRENDIEIYKPEYLYKIDIQIISNIKITTKSKIDSSDKFYFKDMRIPRINISLTKSTIGKKTEYYISSVNNNSNWIETDNSWMCGYLEYFYIEKYESIDSLLDGIVDYNRLFILSHCLDVEQVQTQVGFINLKNICDDYSIFNENDMSKFRITDMIDELNNDYSINPKFEPGLVVNNLKLAGFNII